ILEIVPFVEDAGQAKMGFMDNLLRLIACPLKDAPVGLGCLIELVVRFLYVAQANGRQYQGEHSSSRLTERYGFRKCLPCSGAVPLENVGISQCPVGGSAGKETVRVQIFQGAV